MEKKLWYACMMDREDSDWGTGSFDLDEAIKTVKSWKKEDRPEAYIAVIDADYDDDGFETTDPICVEEIEVENDSEITDAETDAAALFDGGWKSTDKEDLIDEYDLSEEDAERLCNELEKLEARQ